jgi:hypothetical protein
MILRTFPGEKGVAYEKSNGQILDIMNPYAAIMASGSHIDRVDSIVHTL